jgi:hypothetical protein
MVLHSSRPRMRKYAMALAMAFFSTVAVAAIYAAAQIAAAILNSPDANAYLKANAAAIGALAVKVESGGDSKIYNGSCCYGVLQMTRTNIIASNMSVSEFQNASLEVQVNAWSKMQSAALSHPVVASLMAMGSFDGNPTDASLVLACVQLGQGNCRKMVISGKCNGFEDKNGTDICEMAAKTRTAIGAAGVGGVVAPVVAFVPTTEYTGNGIIPSLAAAAEPPEEAYQTASGISMSDTAHAIKSVAASLMLSFLLWTVVGTWGAFVKGKLTLHAMTETIVRGTVITIIVLMLTLG